MRSGHQSHHDARYAERLPDLAARLKHRAQNVQESATRSVSRVQQNIQSTIVEPAKQMTTRVSELDVAEFQEGVAMLYEAMQRLANKGKGTMETFSNVEWRRLLASQMAVWVEFTAEEYLDFLDEKRTMNPISLNCLIMGEPWMGERLLPFLEDYSGSSKCSRCSFSM